MEDVRQHGRTVLFVSHNMSAITRLCPRAILLDQGRIIADSTAQQVVRVYLESGIGLTAAREWSDATTAPGGSVVRLRAVRVRSAMASSAEAFDIRQAIALEMDYEVLQSGHVLSAWYEVFNQEGLEVFSAVDLDPLWHRRPRPVARYRSTAWIPGNLMSEGTFVVRVGMATMNPQPIHLFYERDVVAFQVFDTREGDSARGDWTGEWGGVIRPLLKWETQYISEPVGTGAKAAKDRVPGKQQA
jgi:lipopolysaccharide transport system ATP-binding protein